MASNGVILLNLNNRNAADFQRLEVPDSYEKASGALTAGTYVTVYKWLYQGFMMAPSLCDAVDADDHINLVDRTNGGILEVYPDDTIEILSEPTPEPEPEPEPEPGILVHDDPYYRKAVKVYRKTGVAGKLFIENGITEGDGQLKTFVGDGVEIEITASSLVGYNPGVYVVTGICIIQHGGTAPDGDWYFTSTAYMNIYSPTLSSPWSYVGPGYSVTQGWPDDGSETSFYYVFEHRNTNPGSGSNLTLVPLSVSEPGFYDPADYNADGFDGVTVISPPPRATRVWTHSTGGSDASVYMQSGTYENGVFVPSGEITDVLYTGASDWVTHGIVQVRYGGGWNVRGYVPVQFDGNSYPAFQVITTWNYSTSVDYMFIETTY